MGIELGFERVAGRHVATNVHYSQQHSPKTIEG